MLTRTFDQRSTVSTWAPALFKATAAFTFAVGVAVHVGRMTFGLEPFVRQIFTPPVDVAFGVLMLLAAIPGILAWRRYSGSRAGRIVYGFAMVILIVSVPLHLRTAFTWSTDYLMVFPFWYSATEVPMFMALSYAMTRLKFGGVRASASRGMRTL